MLRPYEKAKDEALPDRGAGGFARAKKMMLTMVGLVGVLVAANFVEQGRFRNAIEKSRRSLCEEPPKGVLLERLSSFMSFNSESSSVRRFLCEWRTPLELETFQDAYEPTGNYDDSEPDSAPETTLAFVVTIPSCPEDPDAGPDDPGAAFYDAAAVLRDCICNNTNANGSPSSSAYNATMYAIIHPSAIFCNGPTPQSGSSSTNRRALSETYQYDRAKILEELGFFVRSWGDQGYGKDLMRLYAYKLTRHDIAIMTKFDTVFNGNLDDFVGDLISDPIARAYYELDDDGLVNTGNLLIKPSEIEYNAILDGFKNDGSYTGGASTAEYLKYYFSESGGHHSKPINTAATSFETASYCGKPWQCFYDDAWNTAQNDTCREMNQEWYSYRASFESRWSKTDLVDKSGTYHPDFFDGYCYGEGPNGYQRAADHGALVIYECSTQDEGSVDIGSDGGTILLVIANSDSLCTLSKVMTDGSHSTPIPIARSYESNEWESAAGPTATVTFADSPIACADDSCSVTLPSLTGAKYVLTTFKHSLTAKDEAARFLEKTTFGQTSAEITALTTTNLSDIERATFVKTQMDSVSTPPSSHREYYRKRVNPKWMFASINGLPGHPCNANSLWRRYAFTRFDRNGDGSDPTEYQPFYIRYLDNYTTPLIFEAEEAVPDGGWDGYWGDFRDTSIGWTGTGYRRLYGSRNPDPNRDVAVKFNITVPSLDSYPLTFRYALGSTDYSFPGDQHHPYDIKVNGVSLGDINFLHTDGWDKWHYTDTVYANLNVGENIIVFNFTERTTTTLHLDHLRIGLERRAAIVVNGHVRTVVDGIKLARDYDYQFKENTPYYHRHWPIGPSIRYERGRLLLTIENSTAGASQSFRSDTGNPPIDFTNSEEEISNDFFDAGEDSWFTLPDGGVEFTQTYSTLDYYQLLPGQERLLVNGLSGAACARIPERLNMDDPPVYGRQSDGTWWIWSPVIKLEENTPSNPVSDGGGDAFVMTDETTRCMNAPRTFLNEDSCTLSTSDNACRTSATLSGADILLDKSNIIRMYRQTDFTRYVYAMKGFLLDSGATKEHNPCEVDKVSRWEVSADTTCANPTTGLGPNTMAALNEIFTTCSDVNPYIKDCPFPTDHFCDGGDEAVVDFEVQFGADCYTLVHPNHLDVYDCTGWVTHHPGGAQKIMKWAENGIDPKLGAIMYTEDNFNGVEALFEAGVHYFWNSDNDMPNDQLSSFKIMSGFTATIWSNGIGSGWSIGPLAAGDYTLANITALGGIDNQASSMVVEGEATTDQGWFLMFPSNTPNVTVHPMLRWETKKVDPNNFEKVGRFGDSVKFRDLPSALRVSAIAEAHGADPDAVIGTDIIVCGSIGEVANDNSLGEEFNLESDTPATIGSDYANQQKAAVWYNIALSGGDQLRQRAAWALSQILVVVPDGIDANDKTELYLNYYDIFVRNAFGNYLDILKETSYSPLMAEHLSYLDSKSHAYIYETENKRVAFADENFAREVMQLFSVGLDVLNEDGTPKLDSNNQPLQVYTNNDIMSFARAWTGFRRHACRGNIEEDSTHSSRNRMDPMAIEPVWRDGFPKSDLEGGYIGDRYPLCTDLPDKMFLKEGATYRLLGGNPLPELLTDNENFHKPDVKKFVLNTTSSLYSELYNNGVTLPIITLKNSHQCVETECLVDTVRVVKVADLFYEYKQPPCVQQAFYNGAKKIERERRYYFGTICANPALPHAGEACCDQADRTSVKTAGRNYFYENERMSYSTAEDRCGGNLCEFRIVERPDDKNWKTHYHWTNTACSIQAKVNNEGMVAIVHDTSNLLNLDYHIREESLNYFSVYWEDDGLYPSASNNCGNGACKVLADNTCLCQTNVEDVQVFADAAINSVDDIITSLKVGHPDPNLFTDVTYVDEVNTDAQGHTFTTYKKDGIFDKDTIFEVVDKKGRTFFLKNVRSTVKLEGWTHPPMIVEAETAENTLVGVSLDDYTARATGPLSQYVKFGSLTTDIAVILYNDDNFTGHNVSYTTGRKWFDSANNDKISSAKVLPGFTARLWQHGIDNNAGWNVTLTTGEYTTADIIALGGTDESASSMEVWEESYIDWSVVVPSAGPYEVFLRYAHDDSSSLRPVEISVNGNTVDPSFEFPITGDWTYFRYHDAPLVVTLNAGQNTIRTYGPETKGPYLDHMRIEGLTTSTTYSFKNPVHFMGIIQDPSSYGIGEVTLRDAQYETDAVLQHYFYHDNAAPFLCTRFIQRFGVSNPTPRYVRECSLAFTTGSYSNGGETFGTGNYGDLEAAFAAVTLDREATSVIVDADPSSGSLREPLLKVIGLMRSMEYTKKVGEPVINLRYLHDKFGQAPFEFPSVFSFFLPEYIPAAGPAQIASLTAPESILVDMPKSLSLLNGMFSLIKYGLSDCLDESGVDYGLGLYFGFGSCRDDGNYERAEGYLNYSPSGTTISEKIDDLSSLLTAGRLTPTNKQIILDAVNATTDEGAQVRLAQQLIITSSEFHSTGILVKPDVNNTRPVSEPPTSSGVGYKAIVYLFLNGGTDSYNMLTPHTCPVTGLWEKYVAIRENVALYKDSATEENVWEIPAGNTAQPCDSFGIHRRLPLLKNLYDQNEAIFVANAGVLAKPVDTTTYRGETPVQLFAHNAMQVHTKMIDVYEEIKGTGVLGRLGAELNKNGKAAGAFSIRGNQITLIGKPGEGTPPVAVSDRGLPDFNGDPSDPDMKSYIEAISQATLPTSSFFGETWSSSLFSNLASHSILIESLSNTTVTTAFPDSDIGRQLSMVSKLMQTAGDRGVDADLFHVETGGYDTHASVQENLELRFDTLDAALQSFVDELKLLKLWDQVVITQFSEFARTLNPNSGAGTDHAWGGNHFILGGKVNGGKVLGTYPDQFVEGLSNIALSRGRMIPTTPWDATWQGISQWMGLSEAEIDLVLPNRGNFDPSVLFTGAALFTS